ncbi:MAG: hypothetical protein Q7R58_02370 [bacterium]|nr:hypothetical protein [bacterium]
MGKLSVLSKQIERDFSGVEFAAPATPEGARSRIMYLFDVRLNDGAGERDYSRVASGLSDHIARALKVNKYRPRLCKSREALRQKLFQGEE